MSAPMPLPASLTVDQVEAMVASLQASGVRVKWALDAIGSGPESQQLGMALSRIEQARDALWMLLGMVAVPPPSRSPEVVRALAEQISEAVSPRPRHGAPGVGDVAGGTAASGVPSVGEAGGASCVDSSAGRAVGLLDRLRQEREALDARLSRATWALSNAELSDEAVELLADQVETMTKYSQLLLVRARLLVRETGPAGGAA